MEIKDYLRVLGKRAWLLVMIPAVAGVVAGLIAVGQPQAFRTTATLQLPRDETTTPAQVAQLVADFQAAADNPTVQNQVSEETGVPVKRIERVRITQVGDSSQLTMSFQDKRKDATEARAVINGLAGGALGYLQTPELRNSQQAVDAADARIDAGTGGDRRSRRRAQRHLRGRFRPAGRRRSSRTCATTERQFYERRAGGSAGWRELRRHQPRTEASSTQVNLRIFALEEVHAAGGQRSNSEIAAAQETLDAAEEERGSRGGAAGGRRPSTLTSPSRLRGSRSCARRGS